MLKDATDGTYTNYVRWKIIVDILDVCSTASLSNVQDSGSLSVVATNTVIYDAGVIVHNLFKSNSGNDPVAQNDGQTEATITNPFTFTNNDLASCFGYELDSGDNTYYSLTATSVT